MTARLRLLYSSNAFWCASGYGSQGKSLLPRFAELPIFGGEPGSTSGRANVSMFAWFGLQGGVHNVEGFRVYPGINDPYGNDVIGMHAKDFGANVVVTLIDAWVLKNVAQSIAPALFCPYFPVDHDPIPEMVLKGIEGAHMPISYAKWGRDMLDAAGVKNAYIPHGVEPGIFRVLDRDTVQQFRREHLRLNEGAHLSMMVSANKGHPDRKWFQGQLEAWRDFAADKPHARLYLHTDATTVHGGINFPVLIEQLGLQQRVMFPELYHYRMGMPQSYMALLYNAADCFMGASMSEGFGIPLIEAQACGTPVITTNFSSMPELVRFGYTVDVADMVWTPMNSYQAWPSKRDMTDKLNRLYDAWLVCGGDWPMAKREATSQAIHAEYGWDMIVRDYWAPLFDQLADAAPPLNAAFQAQGIDTPKPAQDDVQSFVEAINEGLAQQPTPVVPRRRVAPLSEPVTERSVEIPWLLANLGTPQRILDIGSADATYIDALVATGAKVTLCDTRPVPLPKGAVGFVGSAAELPEKWTAHFDLVTCISVLDHIGLDAYGNAADDTLLARTVAELARVTAPGGRLLLTVPFGRDHVTTHPGGGQRVFSLGALRALFDNANWTWGEHKLWQLAGNVYKEVQPGAVRDSEYGSWRALAVIALELTRVAEVVTDTAGSNGAGLEKVELHL